jgi:hypothetical protein
MRVAPITVLFAVSLGIQGCAPSWEGDDPGECFDEADNDRDELFDCEDPDCVGAPVCIAADRPADGSEGPVFVEPPVAYVAITAPNWGYDLATDRALITLEGYASDDVATIRVVPSAGSPFAPDGVQAWAAEDIPLSVGDNTIVVEATSRSGEVVADSIAVTYNPGVSLRSNLELSAGTLFTGLPKEVRAAVWLAPDAEVESVEVGPANADGALQESWATLAADPDHPGYWVGAFELGREEPEQFAIRAVARVGGASGATPPVGLRVIRPPTLEQLERADEIGAVAAAAQNPTLVELDPMAARGAVLDAVLQEEGVLRAGVGGVGSYLTWWEVEPGLTYALPGTPAGYLGGGSGGGTSGPPRQGRGALRGWTHSSAGRSGRGRPAQARQSGPVSTGNAEASFLSPFDFAYDASRDLSGSLPGVPCPRLTTVGLKRYDDANLEAAAIGLRNGQIVWTMHGDTVTFSGAGSPILGGLLHPAPHPGSQVLVWLKGNNPDRYLAEVADRQLVRHATKRSRIAFLPRWIEKQTAGRPLPASIVSMSACRSLYNETMAAAFLSNGAGAYLGFSGYVMDNVARAAAVAFWSRLMPVTGIFRGSTGEAWDHASAAAPNQAAFMGATDLYVLSEFQNGSFEMDPPSAGWEAGSASSFEMSYEAHTPGGGTLPGSTSPVSSRMGWLKVGDGDNFDRFQQPWCPAPGQEVTMSLHWNVIHDVWSPCTSSLAPELRVWLDTAEGDQMLLWASWNASTAEMLPVCLNSVNAGGGSYLMTGWQTAEVTFTAPATDPLAEFLTVSVWINPGVADAWYGLVDEIKVGKPATVLGGDEEEEEVEEEEEEEEDEETEEEEEEEE